MESPSIAPKIYSYVLRFDDGAAPNPFWEVCTLAICKPAIRRTAEIGDWVIGTGSKNSRVMENSIVNLSDSLVYAMKISSKKTLEEYDSHCIEQIPEKIPIREANDWRLRMGDCIYDYSKSKEPTIRRSVHNETNRKRDLSGINALLSNHFYYFGVEARPLPDDLKQLIKRNQGHRVIENSELIQKFEVWIRQFDLNKLYANPQLMWRFNREITEEIITNCAKQDFDEDEDETCETIC